MPTVLDVVYAAAIAVGWPLYDYFIDWPRFRRQLREHPQLARLREYRLTIVMQWLLVAVGVSLWLRGDRPWPGLNIQIPVGWRLWASAAFLAVLAGLHTLNIIKVRRSARARAHLRAHMTHVEPLLPYTANELAGFLVMSVTAGICEEFLFRRYLLWALAPSFGWWGAVVFSVFSFGLVHAYQGWKGMIQATILGALMMLIISLTRSLLPAMALHTLLDVGSGFIAWIALRDQAPVGQGEQATARAT